jgi:uncharacterized membrane protein
MRKPSGADARLAVLCLAGFAACTYPLLSAVDGGTGPFGIPALFVYLFCVWAALIAVIVWLRR